MNGSKYILIIIFFLTIVNFLLVYQFSKQRNYYQNCFNECKERELYNVNKLEMFSRHNIYQQETEGSLLKNMELVKRNNEILYLNTLISNSPILFFRFREEHCGECIHLILELLKENALSLLFDKMVILSGYSTMRPLKAFILQNKLNIPIYNVLEIPNFAIESLDLPYFFVLDSKMQTKNVFIPIKSMPDNTLNYLLQMQKKHWNATEN